jgi:hypothetical protein
MKLYRKPNQSGCKFHPGFATNLGNTISAGRKGFWLLILFWLGMMKGFIGLFYPHAPQKRRYGDEKYVRW